MSELLKLPNIGSRMEQQLLQIGIDTPEKLRQIGSRQAWLSIKESDPSACYNRLCCLEGAIQGVRWHFMSDEIKQGLKEFYSSSKTEKAK